MSTAGRMPFAACVAISLAITAAAAIVLYLMGQVLICECGYVELWHGETQSSGNSQHISDWYSLSHMIHGFLFFAVLCLLGRWLPVGVRLVLATAIEGAWEIFENTPFVINRYRESTLSLDYFGDSVLNSVTDIGFMMIGFVLAWRLPVWLSAVLVVAMELIALYAIRDNLALNILMLLHPVEAVKTWQMGG
jgi:hypothetical protein